MSINNLQFWLSSVLSLLININQETILDFLNIDGLLILKIIHI